LLPSSIVGTAALHLVESSREGLGRWLRRTRKARGLTLAAIAAETKIPRPHLEALEQGEPLALPAFYQRAELKAVARALGLDEQHALSKLDAVLPPVEPVALQPDDPPRRVRLEYILLLGVAVLVAWMLGWGAFARPADAASTVRQMSLREFRAP
jgi:cytoskeletal protein RodZ